MREIYRVLVELRAFGRRHTMHKLPRGLEACWVASAIDLHPDDQVNDAHIGRENLVGYVRAIGRQPGARRTAMKSLLSAVMLDKSKTVQASKVLHRQNSLDRLMCAAGMAMAIQTAKPGASLLTFVMQGELRPADWARLLVVTGQKALPLVIVLIGSPKQRGIGSPKQPSASVDLRGVARKAGLASMPPTIQVDAGDAIALYRVTQESLVRVRADGGPVFIECVPSGLDPILAMRRHLLARGLCSERWLDGVDASVAQLLVTV